MLYASGGSAQNRKYNGKEFIEAYGLDTYDYGFRGYYPAIGRFTSIDPMAELTLWQSTYSYASNNSVRNVDYMGLSSFRAKQTIFLDDNAFRYTEIDNNGRVILHIDDENDKRVMMVNSNGDKFEIGTEIDDEDYEVGQRVYFRLNGGGVRMFYNYDKYIWVRRNTPFEERVAKWLRAQNVDDWEKEHLEKARPIIQGLVLSYPILCQVNDIKTLTTNSNIYGTEANDVDKTIAILSLIVWANGCVKQTDIIKPILPTNHKEAAMQIISLTNNIHDEINKAK